MKKIIVFSILFLFFIPSLILGGEWEIIGQLPERISSGARIIQLSDSTCNLLGYSDLAWVGGGAAPDEDYTDHWIILNLQTGETVFQGQMLDKRSHFPGTEIQNSKLLLISGINENGEITSCEILNLKALVDSMLTLSFYTDDVDNASSGSDAVTMKNNNVLYGGGSQSDAYKWQIYDVDTEIWGSIFYSTIGRHDFELQLDSLSDNVIAMDGNPTYGEIEILNPATTEWTLGPAIPQPVYGARTEVVSDSQIALTGGYAWGNYFSQTVLYNTASNTITELDSLPLGCCSHGAIWIEPSQKLFIGGGSVSPENGWNTKTCYSYQVPTLGWTNEGELNRYQSWINFFLTNDYHIFAIGNQYNGRLELYTWNHAPFISEYTYGDGNTAHLYITANDPDDNDVSVKLFFIEDADTTETVWSDYQNSGYTFEYSHAWNSSTSNHNVICSIRDQYEPEGVHNSIADSTLVPNISVDTPDIGMCAITIHPNPIRETAEISFYVAHSENIRISIYDSKGRLKDNKYLEGIIPGNHTLVFEMSEYASGIYFIKLSSANYSAIKKLVILR